jgi:hypothetical protein
MAAVYSKNLRIFNAEQFKESVSEAANTSLFITIGKIDAWSNEASPNIANTSVAAYGEVWRNMIGGKRITGNDVKHVVPRYNWTSNTVYIAYDDRVDSNERMADNVRFYVLTTDWHVYKCIANNNGANSTTMPTSVSTSSAIQTQDGYIWKYMYTVSPSEQLKFTTANYIPVKTLSLNDNSRQWEVQENAVEGSIESIIVVSGGTNYRDNTTITLTIAGDGESCNAYARVNTTSNTINAVVVTTPGSGYSFANVRVTDSSGNGTGAILRAVMSPIGGHGSDPLHELGGSRLILNPRISGTESGKLPTTNEFRQISLLQDPYILGTSNVITNTVFQQYSVLTVNGVSVDYVEDEYVYQGASLDAATFYARVVEWDSSNSQLKVTNVFGTPTTSVLVGATSSANRFVDSITDGELEPRSGEILYIDNIVPIARDADQTEDFKIVLVF